MLTMGLLFKISLNIKDPEEKAHGFSPDFLDSPVMGPIFAAVRIGKIHLE